MEKNLIVEIKLRSGKRHTFETDDFKQGQLEGFIEEVEFRGSSYFAIDETLFVRLSEIESFEDMSHLDFGKTDGGIEIKAAEIKSEGELDKIARHIKGSFEKLK